MRSARAEKARKAELARLKTRAQAAMVAGKGMYNVNPWSFVLGVLGALFALLLTLDWLLRDDSKPSNEAPATSASESEIWIEVE